MKPPYAIGSVPSLSGREIAYRWRSPPRVRRHRAGKPQGSSERVLPWQITMDQLIFASLSRTHYWYEVGMLKVPASIKSVGSSSPEYALHLPLPSLLQLVPLSLPCRWLFNLAELLLKYDRLDSTVPRTDSVVVVVFFTLTDRASTIPNNTRGCQSGTWSAGQKKIRGTSTKLQ